MPWRTISINTQNIVAETGMAVLVSCPKHSGYSGFRFWHPSSCIRRGRNAYETLLSFTDEWEFTLFREGKGKTNKGVRLEEMKTDGDFIAGLFEGRCGGSIKADEVLPLTHKPETLQAVDIEADEELRDD